MGKEARSKKLRKCWRCDSVFEMTAQEIQEHYYGCVAIHLTKAILESKNG